MKNYLHHFKTMGNSLGKKGKFLLLLGGGALLLVIFIMIPGKRPVEEPQDPPQKMERPSIRSVKEAVDPRALWADSLSHEMKVMREGFEKELHEERARAAQDIRSLQNELNELKLKQEAQVELKESVRLIDAPQEEAKPSSTYIHLALPPSQKNHKNLKSYIPAGSFARSVLLTGIAADTGTDAASSPQPILLRLVDHGIFSHKQIKKPIKNAIIIGSCYGNISSERALCRLESLTIEDEEKEIIELKVEGWIMGEDGREGLKGTVVDKASEVARMAALNGILGGIAGFFQNQATSSVYPVSPLTGQTNALKGMDALKAGGAAGVGNALQKLADYAIKRAEQMNPVIVVGSGRMVDVVFKKGFSLQEEAKKETPSLQPLTSGMSESMQKARSQSNTLMNRQEGKRQAQEIVQNLSMGDF